MLGRNEPSLVARITALVAFGLAVYVSWGVYSNLTDGGIGPADTDGGGLFLALVVSVLGVVFALVWTTRKYGPAEVPTGRHENPAV